MSSSMNLDIGGVNIINILPVELHDVRWYCIAFEPKDEHMGDAMHLTFVYKRDFEAGDDLIKDITSIWLGRSPAVRVHSECLLGDAFGSSLCDCGEQLQHAMQNIIAIGAGVVVYLRQEGRGIGMRAKLACLAVQEGYIAGVRSTEKMSPDSANLFSGFPIDNRDYSIVPKILQFLNIDRATVLTGNPDKLEALQEAKIDIDEVTDTSKAYIPEGSRKHQELVEKVSRNYQYRDLRV